MTISGIGQADDTGLLSNCIHSLQYLLQLSQTFCKKYGVSICAEKTKLQVFTTKNTEEIAQYCMKTSPISIDGEKVEFSDSAEHVGIVRSTAGNLPVILARIIAHKNTKENMQPDHFCSYLWQHCQIDLPSSPDFHIFIPVTENTHNGHL